MTLTPISIADVQDMASLFHKLWPEESLAELEADFRRMLNSDRDLALIVRAHTKQALAGAHAALRSEYVAGATSYPVAYLEGIYVDPRFQRQGIARKLVGYVEQWAREHGCEKLASDTELTNLDSQAFHQAMDFEEVIRVVCYIKPLA